MTDTIHGQLRNFKAIMDRLVHELTYLAYMYTLSVFCNLQSLSSL